MYQYMHSIHCTCMLASYPGPLRRKGLIPIAHACAGVPQKNLEDSDIILCSSVYHPYKCTYAGDLGQVTDQLPWRSWRMWAQCVPARPFLLLNSKGLCTRLSIHNNVCVPVLFLVQIQFHLPQPPSSEQPHHTRKVVVRRLQSLPAEELAQLKHKRFAICIVFNPRLLFLIA